MHLSRRNNGMPITLRTKELLWSGMSRETGTIVWWMRNRGMRGRNEERKSKNQTFPWKIGQRYVSIGDDLGIRFSRAWSCWLRWCSIGTSTRYTFSDFPRRGNKKTTLPRFVTRRRMDLEREIEISPGTIYYFPLAGSRCKRPRNLTSRIIESALPYSGWTLYYLRRRVRSENPSRTRARVNIEISFIKYKSVTHTLPFSLLPSCRGKTPLLRHILFIPNTSCVIILVSWESLCSLRLSPYVGRRVAR